MQQHLPRVVELLTMLRGLRIVGFVAFGFLLWQLGVPTPGQIRSDSEWSPRLQISVVDEETGSLTAARLRLELDGRPHEPRWIGSHGLRFVSVHISKQQSQVVTYSRGSGPVEVPLSPGVQRARIHVTKGFDYIPKTVEVEVGGEGDPVSVEVPLRRWNRLREQGWRAADAHLHYDRVEPRGDRDWFAMMAGDGLHHAQFMVLKGGMVPGIWARQYGYGPQGTHSDGKRLIIPGEEYRDQLQGHTLLFGLRKLIQPIMAGRPDAPYNYPPLADVLRQTRELGGFAGVAHGGRYGGGVTAIRDALLGAVDFWEIGNSHLYELENWYRLMNCGFILPPTAGTDLPNNPYRDWWQPFLGGMRMYVRSDAADGTTGWNNAVRRGEVFVSSGPIIHLSVNGKGPGGTIRLPAEGGFVEIETELASPLSPRALELVHNGKVMREASEVSSLGEVQTIKLRWRLEVRKSGWIAARGTGVPIESVNQDAIAHSAAVRVLVGNQPIWSDPDAEFLGEFLDRQKQFYETNGSFERPEHRRRTLDLYDQALEQLAASASAG